MFIRHPVRLEVFDIPGPRIIDKSSVLPSETNKGNCNMRHFRSTLKVKGIRGERIDLKYGRH